MRKLKGQYLSLDAIIAAIIFIMLVVSLFSYLKFSIFSQQFYESDIDSATVYVSSLLFAPYDNRYTILDTTRNGKYLNPAYLNPGGNALFANIINRLNKITPYKTNVIITCKDGSSPLGITMTDVRWVSHIRRSLLAEKGGSTYLCNVDIYLGVEEK